MENSGPSWSIFEWMVGLALSVISGAVWVFVTARNEMVERINSVAETAKKDDQEIWRALNDEKDSTKDFREGIIAKVAQLPTRDDHQQMETRLMDAIRAKRWG